MKPFFWKIVICLVPNLLAGWFVWQATDQFMKGKGGFKLGVDLVGGTILVYEVDQTKSNLDSRGVDTSQKKDTLATYLKRRIDPNDLYNIVVRMVGDNRVEIILPTGGEHRAELVREAWKDVLTGVKTDLAEKAKNYGWPRIPDDSDVFHVGQGKVQELAELIKQRMEEKRWPELLKKKKIWDKLKQAAKDEVPIKEESQFDNEKKFPPGQYRKLVDALKNSRKAVEKIKSKAQTAAWEETLAQLEKEYPKAGKLSPDKFSPERRDQLITYIEGDGNPIAQSARVAIAPLFPKDEKAQKISRSIDALYGPSMDAITNLINSHYKAEEQKGFSTDEVERIKSLIRQVGKLEFLILANSRDDKEGSSNGVDDAQEYLRTHKEETDKFAKQGLPPPTSGKVFTINLAHDTKSNVSYRWVEISPKYRKELGLSNRFEGKDLWNRVARARDHNEIAEVGNNFIYSRPCTNQNLPEEVRKEKKYEYFYLVRNPEKDEDGSVVEKGKLRNVDGDMLSGARRDQDKYGKLCVNFTFGDEGARRFRDLTRRNSPSERGGTQFERQLAIVLDGEIMSAPSLQSEIGANGQITGGRNGFTPEEVDRLVNILRSGALPKTLKPQPVSENTMGATLGQDTIKAGVQAVGLAFLFVLLFMVVYYRFSGLVACVALLSNLLLTVGFMVAVQATFTLPGLAGLVLMLGMAVDANVLIYERLREERDRGASLALAIRNGYDRAFPTIIDTHLTSIFTAIVLYVVGNDQLKGFGVSLTVGLIISLFTSLYMTRLMFDIWLHRGWLKKLGMFRLLSRTNIDFMAIRYYWFTATILLTIIGVTVFLIRGKQGLNIDFVGGTAYGAKLVEPISLEKMRKLLDENKKLLAVAPNGVKELDDKGRYQITYAQALGDDKTRVVGFANPPDLPTRAEREAEVRKRTEELPDLSVEQIFLGSQSGDKSDRFTLRTAEKEAKLVQSSVDRLLHEQQKDGKWKNLLDKITIDRTTIVSSKPKEKGEKKDPNERVSDAVLYFSNAASPSFVTTLLAENLEKYKSEGKKAIPFTLLGEGQGDESRYKIMNLSIPDGIERWKLEDVLKTTANQFNQQPQPERLENFDSALAAETQGRAIIAIVLSWGAILLYLWLRFGNWTFGLAAVFCLIHDLFFTLGLIAFASYLHGTAVGNFLLLEDFKLDLTGVAALLTLVGYSVSDTIVVFDRIREVRGKNPELTPQMINDSVNQTLSRTLLTAFSVWLVVSVLYIFGGPGVHLFAYVMVIGVIVGTYSSIYIASPLLLIFGEGKPKTAARVRERQAQPAETTA
jgi:SecD/SecF fusion protein